jgi:hypothetical protein
MVSAISDQDSSNFPNSDSQVLSTHVIANSWNIAKLVIGNKYSIGINTSNPYTNKKGVWPMPTLKANL